MNAPQLAAECAVDFYPICIRAIGKDGSDSYCNLGRCEETNLFNELWRKIPARRALISPAVAGNETSNVIGRRINSISNLAYQSFVLK